jgi:hypothetical protein
MEEVWKPVLGFKDRYEVSDFGRVRGLPRRMVYSDGRVGMLRGGVIKGGLGQNGYYAVTFDSKCRKLVHRVVAEAFLENPKNCRTVNHKDGDKTNNSVSNLEWASYRENNVHARSTGLNLQHGERSNLARHSDQFIESVRRVHERYTPTWEELGRLFGIRGSHARQIALRETRRVMTAAHDNASANLI